MNNRVLIKHLLAVTVGILFCNGLFAQSVPVGTPVLDDYYRRSQLLGKVDSNLSFTIRPITIGESDISDVYDPEHDIQRSASNNSNLFFKILPLSWQQQFNTDHPYGWNDEAMIPARGYQTIVSGGFYFKAGHLSVQLRPEFVYAANTNFTGFASGHNDTDLKNYYGFNNGIDLPERFGNKAYSKAFWGQSNIMLTFGNVAFGLSNESIWWGPGINNALILSDNAPGFKHATFNTVKPLNTFLGSFEGQVIAARLDGSDYSPLLTTKLSTGTSVYTPKKKDWRYYTGFNINYHPKFISGFTLGLTRVFDAYHSDVKGFNGYVPFFTRYSKLSKSGTDDFPRNQLTSLYARWLFTKAQAEIYLEYGFNDNSNNLTDLIQSPEHSRAYIAGVRKMIALNNPDAHILVGAEVTQMSQSIDRIVRSAGSWYTHSQVRAGETNLGQVIGAGVGPGGNLQSMEVSWVSGLKKIGVSFERYEHNVDLYQKYFPDINGNSRNWVDLSLALNGEWNYKNLIFTAKIQPVKSLNYEWVLKDYTPGDYYIPHNDAFNLHAQLGCMFRF
jgi:hypothetical protein